MDERQPARRALMIAFHYPPAAGSSGLQRTLSFSRHLPAHGWQPLILSASPRAHAQLRDDQLA
ncbi:MAG: glycosyltransferase, partial [Gammaproteobacteria bacterium]